VTSDAQFAGQAGDEQDEPPGVPSPGLSFRGGFGDAPRENYSVGARFRHAGWLRTSRDVRVATNNFSDRDIVAFFGRDGRDVSGDSDHPDEQETLFGPDAEFTVIAQTRLAARRDTGLGDTFGDRTADRGVIEDARLTDEPWLTVVVVGGREGKGIPTPDEAVQRAGQAIVGARTLPAASSDRPERYRGPIGVDVNGQLQSLAAPGDQT
jgi:hypothetical protein